MDSAKRILDTWANLALCSGSCTWHDMKLDKDDKKDWIPSFDYLHFLILLLPNPLASLLTNKNIGRKLMTSGCTKYGA